MIKSQRKVSTKLSECFPILAKEHPCVKNLEGESLEETLDLILCKVPFPYTSLKNKDSSPSRPSPSRAPTTIA